METAGSTRGRVEQAGDRGRAAGWPRKPRLKLQTNVPKFGLFVLLEHAQGKPRNRFLVNSLNPPCKKGRKLTYFLHFLAISSMTYGVHIIQCIDAVFAEINAPGASFLEAIEKTFQKPPKAIGFVYSPLCKNHPSNPIGYVYSPLWEITHQNPSVLCTPPFEKSLCLVGAYFDKYGTYSVYICSIYCIVNN